MGDDFFDAFDDKIDADWSKVSDEKVEELFQKLSDQDAEQVFDQIKQAIETNNKRKGLVRVGAVILQEAVKLGLKSLS